jgi:predicted nucleic acid-binding protein
VILVDSTIWIDHLNRGDAVLESLLAGNRVLMHPYVIGEIALGSLRHRERVLRSIRLLPELLPVRPGEVLNFIAKTGIAGSGLGYVDAHLLAAARMRPGTQIWSRDKRLDAVAERLGIVVRPDAP